MIMKEEKKDKTVRIKIKYKEKNQDLRRRI